VKLVSDYNRIWAHRYLREALADYDYGSKTRDENQSRASMAKAIRKTQLALEHLFESPDYLELMIADSLQSHAIAQNPKLRLLSTLSSMTQAFSESEIRLDREQVSRMTKEALQATATIMKEITFNKNEELQPKQAEKET